MNRIPLIKVFCMAQCKFRTVHRCMPEIPCGDIGLWWQCLTCGRLVELSAHSASVQERVES